MTRAFNFSPGPALMPESVLREAQDALWELEGSGMGVLEISHRSKAFEAVMDRARERLARLLRLAPDQEILFLHGGARTQFFQVPMNLLRGARATYFDTGIWSAGAIEEAGRFGTADVPFSSKGTGYDHVPRDGSWGPLPAGTRYVHYTSNNTVAGTQFDYIPTVKDAWLICDASSDILSRDLDGSRFDLIYAGAQKNLGPSGVTIVVIRKALLDAADRDLPSMLRYDIHYAKRSLYNTPSTFAIYVVERVCAWIEAQGGLAVVGARNAAQAERVYAAIDASPRYRGKVRTDSRSQMNVTFTTGSPDVDAVFVAEANALGLLGLKGHASVGGLRASLYNAQTDEAVAALVAFLEDFAARHPA